MAPIATDVTAAWSVRLSFCVLSVTLVHRAEAVGQNKIPLGRDTRVVPSKVVLDTGPIPHGRGDLRSEPPVRSDAACYQITSFFFGIFRHLASKNYVTTYQLCT